MSHLSREARRLIELGGPEDEPEPGVQQRLERSLASRIALGLGVGTASTALSSSAAGAGLWAVAGKTAAVAGVVAAVAAGWFTATSERPESSQVPARRVGAATPDSTSKAPEVTTGSASAAEDPPATAVEMSVVAPVTSSKAALALGASGKPATEPRTHVAHSPSASDVSSALPPTVGRMPPVVPSQHALATPPREDSDDPLLAEASGLRAAQQALRAGHSHEALRLIEQQNGRYPGGKLEAERAAARVLALCQSGRSKEARRAAQHFERRWARSPLVARVRSSCRESTQVKP